MKTTSLLSMAFLGLLCCFSRTTRAQEGIQMLDAKFTSFQEVIDQYPGKVVLVDLWATWCPTCRREIANSQTLKKKTDSSAIVFLYAAVNDSADRWEDYILNQNIQGEHLLLPAHLVQELTESINLEIIPRFLLYDRSGKLINDNAPWPGKRKELSTILGEMHCLLEKKN